MRPGEYVDLYRSMARIRAFEETVRRYHIAGKAPGLVHLCTGQEAVPGRIHLGAQARRLHHHLPSRPRPLHRQGLIDGGRFWASCCIAAVA